MGAQGPEKTPDGSSVCLSIRTRLSSIEKPMLNANQILLPHQAMQLGRSYNGRILVNIEISVRTTHPGEGAPPPQQLTADIHEMCIGELPVLTGSCLCHRPRAADNGTSCFFIVSGQCKVIVSQERLLNNHPLISACTLQSRQQQFTCEVRSVPLSNPYRYPVPAHQPSALSHCGGATPPGCGGATLSGWGGATPPGCGVDCTTTMGATWRAFFFRSSMISRTAYTVTGTRKRRTKPNPNPSFTRALVWSGCASGLPSFFFRV